ncbi:MAG: ECF transporter S component [Clostridia bacterium]|nr:ECF transporter S component [Clostridia bacterium]
MKTKKLVTAALFAAIICAVTFFPKVPSVNGYLHLGDAVILMAAFVMGPLYGAAAAAIGSALADIISGYVIFVPGTFMIKFLTAAVAALVLSGLKKTAPKLGFVSYILAGIVGEALMVLGYFAYEAVIYDVPGAAAGIVGNLCQAAAGIVVSTLIMITVKNIKKA